MFVVCASRITLLTSQPEFSEIVKTPIPRSPAKPMRSPTPSNTISKSKSKSLTLSLLQNDAHYQPLPLNIYHPVLRRSPRFNTPAQNDAVKMQNPKRSPKQLRLRLLHANDLRRSPRLNPPPARDNAGESGSEKFRSRMSEQSLRRSPRFSAEPQAGSLVVEWQRSRGQDLPLNDKKDKSILDSKSFHRNSTRRSPRLTSTQSECRRVCRSNLSQKMLDSLAKDYYIREELSNNSNFHLDAGPSPLSLHKGTNHFKYFHAEFFGEKQSPTLNLSTREHTSEPCVEQIDMKLLDGMKVRRSLRISSSIRNENLEVIGFHEKGTSAAEEPLSLHKGPKHFKYSHSEFFGEKQMRKSPRLNTSTREHTSEPCVEQLDMKLLDGMKVRRSPRLSSSSRNENLEVIVFHEKGTSKVAHQKKENSKVVSPPKLSNSSDESPSEVKTTSRDSSPRVHGTKCLRWSSEEITFPPWVENERTNFDSFALPALDDNPPRKKYKTSATNKCTNHKSIPSFVGDPIPDDEAQKRWGWRYELKAKKFKDHTFTINEDEEDEIIVNVKCHYAQAEIENCIFSLGDCAFIKGDGQQNYVGKIIEFFQTTDGKNYFRVQWFYRIEDTVVQEEGVFHDKRRLFYSSIMNDNLIDCIIAKANVTQITPRVGLKLTSILPSDFYYDMEYCVDYSTFRTIPTDNPVKSNELSPPAVCGTLPTAASTIVKCVPSSESHNVELTLLDLYSGCGGMSTGLSLGAKVASINLVTRWAIDVHRSASESLKLNHPNARVRNESAEDFLELLKEWEKLCKRYKVNDVDRTLPLRSKSSDEAQKQVNAQGHDIPAGEYEVSRFVDICYGDPNETGKRSIYLKVSWKGYSASEDTWEPIENLSKCQESIQDFVRKGIKSKILPLPGDADVICGGPPCQGISGYNRYRNTESPLDDERNRQIIVFMDIVKFLKPKYVLMENVVDILRFDKASLARYALSRLVHMNYQARLGTVAAGCYGLPQFRLRVFLWGAHSSEVLPQFPLPTHDVIVRYWPPPEFERNTVAYDEDQPRELEKAVVIQDAISDLPAVTNSETCEEISYQNPPETEFQRYIRSTKYEMTGLMLNETIEKRPLLYDHRPYFLFEDDYLRVCQIPKRKGANFRNLPGVVVGADNVVRRDPAENPLLPSGKPLVPDYAFTFEQGKSKKPFARLWWDETVPTVLTFPSCHNQVVLHPEQDRVLTIREFARLQGFPDYYRFHGTVKERYCQIGNAVAVPVARALGYALGIAYRKLSGSEPLMTLPPKFSHSNFLQLSNNQLGNTD